LPARGGGNVGLEGGGGGPGMNQILVVVFENEARADDGKSALRQLHAEGRVLVHAYAVVARRSDGTAEVQQEGTGPLGVLLGTALGALVGMLGGPVGAAVGAAGGLTLGMIANADQVRIRSDLLEGVRRELAPGRFALVADVDEDSPAPVNARMEKLGATVFRLSTADVRDIADEEDEVTLEAEIARLEVEQAVALKDRGADLRELQARLERAKKRREAVARSAQARREILEARSAASRTTES